MAHKPQSYYLGTTKKGQNFIVLYDNVEPTTAEQKMIDRFIGLGYEVRFESKKPSKTVKEMREELKGDEKALTAFNEAYAEKNGFFGACKIYAEWKKNNK